MKGILGRKVGMTQVFLEDGRQLPVTVIDVSGNIVVQKKSAQGKDGYNAVKIGFGDVHRFEKEGEESRWRMNSPELGVFKKAGIDTPKKHLAEIRVTDKELEGYNVGDTIAPTTFLVGEYVDVTGTSKGRGFAGVMKRHNFHGARSMTHGTHEYFRHAGSIGASADPARVFKGTRMAGHYGNARVTVQNQKVVEIIEDENLILVQGGVPGPNGGLVMIRGAIKKRGAVGQL